MLRMKTHTFTACGVHVILTVPFFVMPAFTSCHCIESSSPFCCNFSSLSGTQRSRELPAALRLMCFLIAPIFHASIRGFQTLLFLVKDSKASAMISLVSMTCTIKDSINRLELNPYTPTGMSCLIYLFALAFLRGHPRNFLALC